MAQYLGSQEAHPKETLTFALLSKPSRKSVSLYCVRFDMSCHLIHFGSKANYAAQ